MKKTSKLKVNFHPDEQHTAPEGHDLPPAKDAQSAHGDVLQDSAELLSQLISAQNAASEWEEKYKRVLADYQNLEQRVKIERTQYIKTANKWLLESLLEPLDFMEKATAHIDDQGLKMVVQRFYQVLDGEGLKEIDALDMQFHEKTMEAVGTEGGEEGKVLKVVSKGFMLGDQVLRHAKVVVGNGEKRQEME